MQATANQTTIIIILVLMMFAAIFFVIHNRYGKGKNGKQYSGKKAVTVTPTTATAAHAAHGHGVVNVNATPSAMVSQLFGVSTLVKVLVALILFGILVFVWLRYGSPALSVETSKLSTYTADMFIWLGLLMVLVAMLGWAIYTGNMNILKRFAIGLALIAIIGIPTIIMMRNSLQDFIAGNSHGMSWFRQTTTNASYGVAKQVPCDVRLCLLVDSKEWSAPIPSMQGIDWVRSEVKGTILEIRINGDNATIKRWGNEARGPHYKTSSYIQVRCIQGNGAIAYFDTRKNIAELIASN